MQRLCLASFAFLQSIIITRQILFLQGQFSVACSPSLVKAEPKGIPHLSSHITVPTAPLSVCSAEHCCNSVAFNFEGAI